MMIITISGMPGSGKSTVGKILARKLGIPHYSTGDLMREIALERGITLEELGERAKTDSSIDQRLDERQKKLSLEKKEFVIDGRLSFYFIPHSVKVFLKVEPKEGARRILLDAQKGLRKEEQTASLAEAIAKIEKRVNTENERFQKYYGVEPYRENNYDLVIDSTNISSEKVAQMIIRFIRNFHPYVSN